MRCAAIIVAALLVASAAAGFYDGKSPVITLTADNFEEKVLKSDSLWIVEFYAPWCGHCKALTPEWTKAAKALKGSVKIAAIDADEYKEIGSKFGVQGFPTIKIFGFDKEAPKEYEAGRKAEDIIATAVKELKKLTNKRLTGKEEIQEEKKEEAPPPPSAGFYENTDVVELTDETFESEVINGKDAWLIEFYAPWCGHCKALTPEWKKAATELAGTMKIGALDATAHRKFSEKYQVQGFPTIKFFAPGKSEEPEDYNGGRTSEAVVDYCLKKAEDYPSAPPKVEQVKDQAALETLCEGKTMCVIFMVQHVIDTGAEGRNKQIEMFVEVAKKFRSRKVAVGWIQGGDHVNFEEGLGIFANYPTFAALNIKNNRVAIHKGAFSQKAIFKRINEILAGKRNSGLSQLKALPKLSKGVELWDGKDYVFSEDE